MGSRDRGRPSGQQRNDTEQFQNGIGNDSFSVKSEHRESLEKFLSKKVSNMEEEFKSVLLEYFDEVDRERLCLVEEVKILHGDLDQLETGHERKRKNDGERGKLIKRLTSNGKFLVQEIERLKQDVTRFKEKESNLINENNKMNQELSFKQKETEELLHEIQAIKDEKSYYKSMAADGDKLRDREKEVVNLESQILFQQKMCKEYSLELAEKDDRVNELKRRCGELEQNLQARTDRFSARHETEKKSIEKELGTAKALIDELERKYAGVARERDAARDRVQSGDKKIEDLTEQINLLRMKDEKTERKHARDIDGRKKLEDELRGLRDENAIMRRQVGALDKDLAISKMRMDTFKYEEEILQKDLKCYESNLKELEQAEKEWKNGEQKMKEELIVTRTKMSHYENESANLASKINRLEDELYCLQDKNVQLQTECDSKEVRDNDLQREVLSHVKKCSQYEQDLTIAAEKLEKAREDYESCSIERNNLSRELFDAQEKVSALEIVIEAGKEEETKTQQQIIASQKRYAKAERELSETCRELESARMERGTFHEKYRRIETAYDQFRHENLRYKEDFNEINRANESLEEKCRKLQQDLRDVEVEKEQLERNVRNKTSDYEHARNEFEYKEKDNGRLRQLLSRAEEELRNAQDEVHGLKRENASEHQRQEMLRIENKEIKGKTDELRTEFGAMSSELMTVQDERTKLQRMYLKLEATNKSLSDQNDALEREAEGVRKQMLDLRFRSNEIDDREAKWKGELDAARNNAIALEERCSDLLRRKREVEEQCASLYKEQSKLSIAKDDAVKSEEQLSMRLRDTEDEVTALKVKLNESEEEIWNLKKQSRENEELKTMAHEEMGRWRRKFEHSEAEIFSFQEKLHVLQDNYWKLEERRRIVEDEKDTSVRESMRLREDNGNMEKQITNLQKREEQFLAEKHEMKKEIGNYSATLQDKDRAKGSIEEERQRIDCELGRKKDENMRLMEKYRDSEEEILKLNDLLIRERNEVRKLETEIEDLNREKRSLENEVNRLATDNSELEALSSGKMKESGKLSIELMRGERKIRSFEEQVEQIEREKCTAEEERKKMRSDIENYEKELTKANEDNEEMKSKLSNCEIKLRRKEEEVAQEMEKAESFEIKFQSLQKANYLSEQDKEKEMIQMSAELDQLRKRESKEGAKLDELKMAVHQVEMQLMMKEEECHVLELKLHEASKTRAMVEGKLCEAQNVIESQREKIREVSKTAEMFGMEAEFKLNEYEDLKKDSSSLKEDNLRLEAEKRFLEEKLNDEEQENNKVEKKNDWLEEEVKRKEAQFQEVKKEAEDAKGSFDRVEEELVDLKKRFNALEREYRSVGEEKDKMEKQIEIAEVEYEELHRELEEKEKENMKLQENTNTIKLLKEDVDMLWENEKNLRTGEQEQLKGEIDELQRKIANQGNEMERMSLELYANEEKFKGMSDELEKYVRMIDEMSIEKEEEQKRCGEEIQRMEEKTKLIEDSGKKQLNEMREQIKFAEEVKNQYAANYSWKMEQEDEKKLKEYEKDVNELKNKLNENKTRAEKSDAEIFRLKAQLDWVEEDRRETEDGKKALQEDFNKCVEELDQTRGQLMENEIEREQLKREVARMQTGRHNDVPRLGEQEKLSEALDETRRQAGEINRLKEENGHLKTELESLTKEKHKLESMINKHDSLTKKLSSETEEARRQKHEKDLLTSQLEAVARERRQLDRLLADKEEARQRLESENEALRKAAEMSKGKSSTQLTNTSWHDEKSALKSELSEVYLKHQRDVERIEMLKAENSKLSRDIEQTRRDVQSRNHEVDAASVQIMKSEPGAKREVSTLFVQQEAEPFVLAATNPTKKASKTTDSIQPELRFSDTERGVDDFSLQSISKNPFLALDKERSKSVDDIDDVKQRRNPFMPGHKSNEQQQHEAEVKASTQQQPDTSPFSLLSDDLRASMDGLDKIGRGDEDEIRERGAPSKDFVNKLRANFEEVKRSPRKKTARETRPKVDLYS